MILFSLFWACCGQAQNLEFVKENIFGIGVNKTVMNSNGELILAGKSGGNPSVMKMDTLGNVLWHKTFSGEPVRNNSHHQWHFWDLRTDAESNIYLFAEQISWAKSPPPRIAKLDDSGELIWASVGLPTSEEFPYEPNISTWLHVGDTALTASYLDAVSRVHLTTGEVLGKDSVLSASWINRRTNDIYYNGKEYRESGLGLLAFDKSGAYSIEPNPMSNPNDIMNIDSTGYYILRNRFAGTDQRYSVVRQLQLFDYNGDLIRKRKIIHESTFNHEDSLSNSAAFKGYLFHPQKGILLFGNYFREINADSTVSYSQFTQVRPVDFEVLYDTIMEDPLQWEDPHFANKGDQIYVQGSRSPGGRGAFVMKVNLKDVDEYPASSVPEKHKKTNTIKIYPNPSTTGEFIIQSKEESISQIEVFTSTGQIVYSHKVNALQENIHMDTKGIYLVRVTTRDNQTETLKIVNQ